ncbi:MAG: radical SAM protein [Candidatus Omnitrophota bacterium]
MKTTSPSYLFSKLDKGLSLFSAQIGLTSRCNENCVHCLVCKEPKSELHTGEIKSVISELKKLNCLTLIFTGGEAMLREDFFDILDFAKGKGFAIRILSNGTLIDETNVKYLKVINPLNMQISLYGATAGMHDSITRLKGSFERTVRAIDNLKKNRIRFNIACMVMRNNFRELPLIREMAKRRRWKVVMDFLIRPNESGSKVPTGYRVKDGQMREAYSLGLLPYMDRNKRLRHYSKKRLYATRMGRGHIFISSDGKVYPGINMRVEVGDLRRDSLSDIWDKSEKLNWLRGLSLSDFECSGCKYLLNCCWDPGLALAEHGDLFKRPKEFCRFTKLIAGKTWQ